MRAAAHGGPLTIRGVSVRVGVSLFFACAVAGALVAAWGGGVLAWDGAYYLFKALDDQAPFNPLGRRINVLLQAPLLWASAGGVDDLSILRRVFALPYALVPVVGLSLSWLVVRRRRPALFVWPALAVGLGLLPGLFFYTSEGPMIGSLAWPLLLGVLLGVPRPGALGLGGLVVVLWVTHPLFVVFATLSAGVALLRARLERSERLWLLPVAVGLLALAALKAFVPLSGYEAESLSLQRLRDAFEVAVRGWPLVSLAGTLAAAALTLAQPWLEPAMGPRLSASTRYAPAALAVAAGVALVPWARNPYLWAHALDYRFWVGPITLGFMGAACLEWLTRRAASSGAALLSSRMATVAAVGAAMLLVLALQTRAWGQQVATLSASLAERGERCVELASLPVIGGSPLNHWGTTSLSLVLQGRQPERVVMEVPEGCAALATRAGVRLGEWETRPFGAGWFSLQRLADPRPPSPAPPAG